MARGTGCLLIGILSLSVVRAARLCVVPLDCSQPSSDPSAAILPPISDPSAACLAGGPLGRS